MLSFVAVVITMLLIPFMLGMYPVKLMPVKYQSMGMTFLMGYLIIFALFQCCYYYFILFDNDFIKLVILFAVLLTVLAMGSAFMGRKMMRKYSLQIRRNGMMNHCIWLPVFLLIAFQMVMLCTRQVTDGDDIYYVSTAVNTVRYSSMYLQDAYTGQPTAPDFRHALSSLPILAAFFSKVTGLAPSILVHTVFPCILLVIIYAVYIAEGRALFSTSIYDRENGILEENIFMGRTVPQRMRDFPCEERSDDGGLPLTGEQDRKVAFFMLAVILLILFGNVSLFTSETFMITRTWQGKAVLASLLLPASLLPGLWLVKEKSGLYIWLFAGILLATGCSSSILAMFLIPALMGLAILVAAVTRKKPIWLVWFLLCCIPELLQIAIFLVKR